MMHGPREYKNWIKKIVKKFSKKSGKVSSGCLDNSEMERKLINSKKNYKRNRKYDVR